MLSVPGAQYASLQNTAPLLTDLNEAHLYFTSPLPLLVPKQQPLLVYLGVFALWFLSDQYSPRPQGDYLPGLFIQVLLPTYRQVCQYLSPLKSTNFNEKEMRLLPKYRGAGP